MITSNLLRTTSRRAAVFAAALAFLAASMLPVHAASAAPGLDQVAQASVKDLGKTHRVPGTCTPWRCR